MEDTIFLRRRHPVGANIRGDGDAVRPIEQLIDGEHSQKRCNRELSHYAAFGTVARVSMTKIRGSDLLNMCHRTHRTDE